VTPNILQSLSVKPDCSIRQKTNTFSITLLEYKYSYICAKNNEYLAKNSLFWLQLTSFELNILDNNKTS